jgi:hypothetical protein
MYYFTCIANCSLFLASAGGAAARKVAWRRPRLPGWRGIQWWGYYAADPTAGRRGHPGGLGFFLGFDGRPGLGLQPFFGNHSRFLVLSGYQIDLSSERANFGSLCRLLHCTS